MKISTDVRCQMSDLSKGRTKNFCASALLHLCAFTLFMLFTVHCSLFTAYAQDRGPLISIELREVELRDVLRALGQEHGINIVVDEKVTGKVTVSLRGVPLWDAIDSVLKGKGYTYIREDNIVRVLPAVEDEDLITKTLNVKYANPKDLEPVISKALSKKGSLASDQRTNSIVIRDIPAAIERAEQMLSQIDMKTGQVMIEAKVVEVNTIAREELGIQWGGLYQTSDVILHGGATKEKSTDIDAIALTEGIGLLGTAFNVNLPADVKEGYGGAIGIGIMANKLTIDLQLSALEEQGSAKILSSPKVMVLDNQEATIASGEQIFIPTTTTTTGTTGAIGTTTAGVTEKEATLRLTVTPRVIDNEQVSLKISTKREEFDFSRSVLGIPPKVSRETRTGVIVKNGETIVIGGIYTEKDFEGESGVPLLSKIPLLGWLFKKATQRKDKTELLIFITPRIASNNNS